MNFFSNSIHTIKDETSRGLIWYNICQMAKLGYMRLDDYVNLVVSKLFSESLEMVLDKLLRYLLSFLKGFVNDGDK